MKAILDKVLGVITKVKDSGLLLAEDSKTQLVINVILIVLLAYNAVFG